MPWLSFSNLQAAFIFYKQSVYSPSVFSSRLWPFLSTSAGWQLSDWKYEIKFEIKYFFYINLVED